MELQDDGDVSIDMTLTAPNCPAADFIMEDGTLVPIRVRGRKEILDTYYDYFVNHFGDSKDTFAE